jgi:hypothetical protein
MEPARCERVVRTLTTAPTRRQALGGVLGAVATALAGILVPRPEHVGAQEAQCDSDADCAAGSAPCHPRVCRNRTCVPGTASPDGTPCGNPCTNDTCQGGVCTTGTPVTCQATDVCHDGVCNPGTGLCGQTPKANGTPCDDGSPGTINSTCQVGVCTGGQLVSGSPPPASPPPPTIVHRRRKHRHHRKR